MYLHTKWSNTAGKLLHNHLEQNIRQLGEVSESTENLCLDFIVVAVLGCRVLKQCRQVVLPLVHQAAHEGSPLGAVGEHAHGAAQNVQKPPNVRMYEIRYEQT